MFSSRFLKTKRRVILIFFLGGGIFLEVSAAELINSIEHNYESELANKTSGKKVVYGAKKSEWGVDWEFILQVVFCILTWKKDMTSFPITKCCKININGLVPKS